MISLKQVVALATYVGAAIVLYLVYLDILMTGWSVGTVLILAAIILAVVFNIPWVAK